MILSEGEAPDEAARFVAAEVAAVIEPKLDDALLLDALEAVIDLRRQQALSALRAPALADRPRLSDFVTESPTMQSFLLTVQRLVQNDSTLLLTGETGAGKEHLARAIHNEGPRSDGPFVAINCGALPEALLESELFGHEEGAFTGANRTRRGRFELAHKGTIFLDEIGELPLHLQVKLLHVLQSREVQRCVSTSWTNSRERPPSISESSADCKLRRSTTYGSGLTREVAAFFVPGMLDVWRTRFEECGSTTIGFVSSFTRRVTLHTRHGTGFLDRRRVAG